MLLDIVYLQTIPMKVLLMVHSRVFSDSIKLELEREHYVVDVAYEDKNGLEMVKNNLGGYGLILLDWMWPMDKTIDITNSIRKEDIDVPVIYLTDENSFGASVFAFKAGANDFVCKPLSLTDLLAHLGVLLNGVAKS